jgi:hypothetical protein
MTPTPARAAIISPGVPFLAPDGLNEVVKFPTLPLLPAPAEWADETDVLELHGAQLKEHVFIHKASRTLVVAELIFNFRADENGWSRFFHRYIAGFNLRHPQQLLFLR